MEVCPEIARVILENTAALCDGALEIGQRREAQMIRYMRHGWPPRLMAPQSICVPERRESLPTPSPGYRMISRTLGSAMHLERDAQGPMQSPLVSLVRSSRVGRRELGIRESLFALRKREKTKT